MQKRKRKANNRREITVNNTLKLWYSESGYKLINLRGLDNVVRPVACSHDDKRFASGSADNTIKIWDIASPEEVEAELLAEEEGRSWIRSDISE